MTSRGRALACRVAGALSVAVVVLATLPRDFQDHPHWQKVAWLPFASGIVRPHDLLLNALIYLPLGFFLQAGAGRDNRMAVAVGAFALSALMEFAQVWSHWRFPSAADVAMNVLGAVVGAGLAYRRQAASRELACE